MMWNILHILLPSTYLRWWGIRTHILPYILTILNLTLHDNGISFYLLFLSSEFCAFPHIDHVSILLELYLSTGFCILGSFVNAVFWISSSNYSLQVYRRALLYIILYPQILLEMLFSSRRWYWYCCYSLGLST